MPKITFPLDENVNTSIKTILKNMSLLELKPVIVITDNNFKKIIKINIPLKTKEFPLSFQDGYLTIS